MNNLSSRFFWLKQLRVIILFSFVINLLYLTGPIFMMQVYDRVLASANIPTLVGLATIALLLYVFFGILEFVRNQALRSNGEVVATKLSEKSYHFAVLNNCDKKPSTEKKQAFYDVKNFRNFLTSPAFSAFFDLPWAPIFLFFIFGLHPVIGVMSVIACILLAILAFINERLSREQLKKANELNQFTKEQAEFAQRNAVALKGNGMIDTMADRWRKQDYEARQKGLQGGGINTLFSTITKTLRLAIQSLLLGAGAYFVIQGEMSPGSIIACTVIFSRALAPLEQILNSFSHVLAARDSWNNIKTWIDVDHDDSDKKTLPDPKKSLVVDNISVQPPQDKTRFIIKNVNFSLQAGDVLGITGHSGSGKSTLAKAIVSAWPVAIGKICLDGADVEQWSKAELGEHIGYLPQDIELVHGTIADNIARFTDEDFQKVLQASQQAGTHQLILDQEDGYNTTVGEQANSLSAGQKQRIALARALYNSPFLVVLDEPDSNLDTDGIAFLEKAIKHLKERKAIVILVSHRPNLLQNANKLLLMKQGEMIAFGSPPQVVEQMKKMANPAK